MKLLQRTVPVVEIGRDGIVRHTKGLVLDSGVQTPTGLYLPQSDSWCQVEVNTYRGKVRKRGLIVREGIPLPVPPGKDKERTWPDSRALEAFHKADLAHGLSNASRESQGKTGLMDSILGIPRPVLYVILGIIAVVGFIILDPNYLDRVMGR